jgi:hypothetical protein
MVYFSQRGLPLASMNLQGTELRDLFSTLLPSSTFGFICRLNWGGFFMGVK